ncbi:MAG: ParA family protein [Planctomycetota bacterium]
MSKAPSSGGDVGRILCVVNQKGGVGKTTTSVNLSAALATAGMQTLLIDMDPQCNATGAVGLVPRERHALIYEDPLGPQITESATGNLAILPGSRRFEDVDRLAGDTDHSRRVRSHLDSIIDAFDYVLIDCPPTVGALTQTALTASTEVLMPIQCEYFAMEGLTQLIEIIRRVMTTSNRRLTFGGILLTMYDPGLELTGEVDAEVRDFFGDIVFDTVVPRDVTLCEAPSHGQTVFQYAPRSRGAFAYTQLCMEVLERD